MTAMGMGYCGPPGGGTGWPGGDSANPYIFVTDGSVTGIAVSGGNSSYCTRPDTEASRYRLDSPISQGAIVKIDIMSGGQTLPAYCIQKGVRAPEGIPYQSMPFEAALPGYTQEQQDMTGWILANGYPSVSAAEMFSRTGVDWSAPPALDDNDAYAAVSAAIWGVLGQVTTDEIRFLNCSGGGLHPKSDRLRQAALALIAMADAFVRQPQPPVLPEPRCVRHCGNGYCVSCCMEEESAYGQPPFLRFACCPREVRAMDGRLWIGPFQLESRLTGELSLDLRPLCVASEDFDFCFVDACCKPLHTIRPGEPFYLLICAPPCSFCFSLDASIIGNVIRIAFLGEADATQTYQKITVPETRAGFRAKASLCVMVEKQCEPCPPCPPCPTCCKKPCVTPCKPTCKPCKPACKPSCEPRPRPPKQCVHTHCQTGCKCKPWPNA